MWESATLGMSECNAWILRVFHGAMAHATEKALHSYHKNGNKLIRAWVSLPLLDQLSSETLWFSAFLVLFLTLISLNR